jgi:hypothetical protein
MGGTEVRYYRYLMATSLSIVHVILRDDPRPWLQCDFYGNLELVLDLRVKDGSL